LKKELHPGAMALIIILAVALLGWYGYQMMKPGDYVPSPKMGAGETQTSNKEPAASRQPKSAGEQAYEESTRGGGPVPGAPGGK
jgi:hypothetical protein